MCAIIGDAFFSTFCVGLIGGVEPAVAAGKVCGYTEAEADFVGGVFPELNEIFFGAHLNAVPWVMG